MFERRRPPLQGSDLGRLSVYMTGSQWFSTTPGGLNRYFTDLYHALNRSNARSLIFEDDEDYAAFERTLGEAVTRHDMRFLAYCLMPNHFHLVVWPRLDGELTQFMRWLTMTHTQRWHAHRHSAGSGHLYQGRFKSFPVQDDGHLLTVCRYVERNALRAGLVERAQLWRWGSLWRRAARKPPEGPALSPWPTERPSDWTKRVNSRR